MSDIADVLNTLNGTGYGHLADVVTTLMAERDHAVRRADVAEDEAGIEHRRANDFCEGMRQAQAERDALAAKLLALETQERAAFVDANGDVIPCRKMTPWTDLYARPVPASQDARDAERYRFLRDKAQQGAVRTLLPLTRAHYVIVDESAHDYPAFDDAIDAAILAAKENKS